MANTKSLTSELQYKTRQVLTNSQEFSHHNNDLDVDENSIYKSETGNYRTVQMSCPLELDFSFSTNIKYVEQEWSGNSQNLKCLSSRDNEYSQQKSQQSDL